MNKLIIDSIIEYIEGITSDKVFIITKDGEHCANPSTIEQISNKILKEVTGTWGSNGEAYFWKEK